MSLFEFSDISKSEETIQRTWEDVNVNEKVSQALMNF